VADAPAVTETVRRVAGLFTPRQRVTAVAAVVILFAGLIWFLVWLITAPPESFRNRAELPSCGRIAEGPGPITGDPVECFDAALRHGGPAELVVTTVSTDGHGPLVTYYRALPGGGAEIFIDATDRTDGSPDWSHKACSTALSLGELSGCVEVS
jgi:hypothetical protein